MSFTAIDNINKYLVVALRTIVLISNMYLRVHLNLRAVARNKNAIGTSCHTLKYQRSIKSVRVANKTLKIIAYAQTSPLLGNVNDIEIAVIPPNLRQLSK